MTTTAVDDFLEEAAGYPSIKFNEAGATLTGDIINPRIGYQRVFGTNEIQKWEDGTPKKQLVLDVRIDPAESQAITVGDGNSGIGTVYCKHAAKQAIQEACSEAGLKLSQCGRIKLRRIEDGAAPKPGYSPTQQFKAKVWPQVNTAADDLDDF